VYGRIEPVDALHGGEVGFHSIDMGAEPTELGSGRVDRGLVGRDQQVVAFLGADLCQLVADAGRGTGDHGKGTGGIGHGLSLLSGVPNGRGGGGFRSRHADDRRRRLGSSMRARQGVRAIRTFPRAR
jgi:hypothetical protein